MSSYPAFTLSSTRAEVHGHRGCRGLLPENTLPAFLLALELGVDVLEMDVIISADAEVVVSHEPWLSTYCRDAQGRQVRAGTEREHNLYHLPYGEIKRCDCGLTPHPGFPRQRLMAVCKPLLRDVVRAVEARVQELNRPAVRYSIEVKSSLGGDGVFHPLPAPFVQLVLAVLQEENILSRVTLLSFDKRILQATRQQVPQLPVCLLVEDAEPCAAHIAALGFMPEIYGPQHLLVTPALVASLHDLGVRIIPWTVNNLADMHRLLQLRVDGLTTDYPNVLLSLLNKNQDTVRDTTSGLGSE